MILHFSLVIDHSKYINKTINIQELNPGLRPDEVEDAVIHELEKFVRIVLRDMNNEYID